MESDSLSISIVGHLFCWSFTILIQQYQSKVLFIMMKRNLLSSFRGEKNDNSIYWIEICTQWLIVHSVSLIFISAKEIRSGVISDISCVLSCAHWDDIESSICISFDAIAISSSNDLISIRSICHIFSLLHLLCSIQDSSHLNQQTGCQQTKTVSYAHLYLHRNKERNRSLYS